MAHSDIIALVERSQTDAKFAEELNQAAGTGMDGIIAVAAKHGITISVEELEHCKQVGEKVQEDAELSDDELDQVAGGRNIPGPRRDSDGVPEGMLNDPVSKFARGFYQDVQNAGNTFDAHVQGSIKWACSLFGWRF